MFKPAYLATVLVAGLLCAAAPASAETLDKLTYLTFSRSVQIPGAILDAGTYRFHLTNPSTGRDVLQVLSRDGQTVYAMFLTIPDSRPVATEEATVTFRETLAGLPPAVRSLFYGGELRGYEFVYPRGSLVVTSLALKQPEITYTPNPSTVTETAQTIQTPVQPQTTVPEETTVAKAEPPTTEGAVEPKPVGTTGELVRTASSLPWIAFGGMSSLILGLGASLLSRRLA